MSALVSEYRSVPDESQRKNALPLRKTSLLFIRLGMKLPGKDIKSHHIAGNFSFLGNGDHQFPGGSVLIGVCKK